MKNRLLFGLVVLGISMSVEAGGVHIRERVEWEHAWMDGTDDTSLPRVLLIGDSVCNAYQGEVRKRLAGVAHVDYWASSKCLTDRSYLTALKLHLDEAPYRVVHFNNGLHSLSAKTDPAEWTDRLREAFRLIRARGKGAAIVWASSTPLRDDPKLGPVVSRLNGLAAAVAAEEGVSVNDLFALMDPLPRETYWSDQYHYKSAGIAKQADRIASVVTAALAKARPLPAHGIGAHRGDCKSFPENTVPAIESAAKKGAQMVEFDVKRCRTGELVVIHDKTVDRTTDGHGFVTNMTFSELRALDAGKKKDKRFAGTRIPTFDEAIDCVPYDGVWINVHCDVGGGVAAEVARGIRAKRRQHQAFISCELQDARVARRAVPEILVCNMTRTGPWRRPWTAKESRDYALDTVSTGCDFLQLITSAQEADIAPVHAAGGKVSYFYTDDPDRARQLFKDGVDFVLTNDLDPMLAAFGSGLSTALQVEDCTATGVVTQVKADDVWSVFGSFGKARGEAQSSTDGFRFAGDGYVLETTVETDGDVSLRKTVLRNVSDEPITANCLMDRFPLGEGDWEVYTQSSYWENESRGRWHDLTTAVEVRNPNMRSGNGAAPMLAAFNRQTGRGRVFHLLTDSAYELHAVRSNPGGNQTTVAVETGMDPRQLAYVLKPGESVALPQVLSYEFQNRTDLDCHKLHVWWHRHYPGRRPPAIYNTWLCRFDRLDADFLLKQVARAKDLGMEYFVIDAGWFGPARDWGSVRGEWVERPDGYLKGRMGEISAAARQAGLKFGFWVEAECVMGGSRVAKEHPEWLLKDNPTFLDFENPAAFDYIVGTVCALLKKYEASYLKFDFNQNLDHDATGRAFTAYNAAYRRFVQEIRRRNSGIYIEGCASGGYMMDLGWARDFDGFWLSDNQSPRHGVRIAKETMLRLPPQKIERWIVACTANGLQMDYDGRDSRLLATEDATWTHVLSYSPSYIDTFAAGGPYGFSCDLTAFSSEHFKHFADSIARRRAEGDFWTKAVGRILCDTPNLTVLQYSDESLSEIRVIAVSDILAQRSVRIYPVLAPAGTYRVNDEIRPAAEIVRTGVELPIACRGGRELVLKRID